MPGAQRPDRWWPWFALALLSLIGLWLRLGPLLRPGGPLAYPIDYDEGVYFSSAALLVRGHLPYRDFVYAHPSGLLVLLAPLAGPVAAVVGLHRAFAVSRVTATVIGAGNIVLVGVIGHRFRGRTAGLVAAALYATFPEVVAVERGPFLEPALNLFVLSTALAWLFPGPRRALRSACVAGAALGAAVATKTWGAFSALACLAAGLPAAVSQPLARRRLLGLVGGAVVVFVVLGLPFGLVAPARFFDDVVRFQLIRPPDGVAKADRLHFLFEILAVSNRSTLLAATHVVSSTAALVGAVLALYRACRHPRLAAAERFFLVLYVVMVIGFLSGRSFYTQYHAHLAIPEVLLAGYGAGVVWDAIARVAPTGLRRPVLALAAAALGVGPVLPAHATTAMGRQHDLAVNELGDVVRRDVPADDCLFSFEPAWVLAGDRLPSTTAGVPLLADPYAAMLLDAVGGSPRRSFPTAEAAFASAASQPEIATVLARCPWVIMGGRGPKQLSNPNKVLFASRFSRHFPPEGATGIDLWRRR